ncbi:MAG TPA: redoxin domain-containing protein, partial [Nannocystaceae bacterium]|nr:redoxin domain-containing protein [Nannocystaceae bacterium]
MSRARRAASALLFGLGCGASPSAESPPQDVAAAIVDEPSAVDLRGAPVDPFASEAAVVVLVFLGRDCPISNKYAPELARVRRELADADVAWWLVFPDPDDDAAAIERHLGEYELQGPALRDPGHALVRRTGVRVTPEVAVLARGSSGLTQIYRGRIDDRWADYGRTRPQVRSRELADAITAGLAGTAPKRVDVPAVGC